jgi:Lrp/AsnC family transcriptional regulator, regulator for asnA, asnC and gidA
MISILQRKYCISRNHSCDFNSVSEMFIDRSAVLAHDHHYLTETYALQRFDLDELDRTIISLLTEDGRLSASEIASKIGTASERTVRNRIAALLQSRMITIGAIPDPTAMGRDVQADIMIEVEPGRIEEVAIALGEFDEVGYLAATCGRFNLTGSLFVKTHADLLDFCENTIGRLPGVRRVEPWVILRMYKAFGTRTAALNAAAESAEEKS